YDRGEVVSEVLLGIEGQSGVFFRFDEPDLVVRRVKANAFLGNIIGNDHIAGLAE
ncbi:MAG: hypothetical protein RL117_1261, partial [Verrucomicrobiota bacterium]